MLARIATSEKEVGLRAALTAVLSELACTFLQSTRERALKYNVLKISNRQSDTHIAHIGTDI